MPTKADLYDSLLVGVGLLIIIFAAKFVPEGAFQTFLIILGFIIVVLDAVLMEILFEVATMKYPYFRLELEPSGKILHCFLEKPPETKQITKIFYATLLKLHWPVEHPYYGKFKELVIHHELPLSDRIKLGPGYAVFQGYAIPHPQVGRAVLHEYPYSGSDRFKDLSRPAFMLAYAHGGDVNLIPLPLTSTFKALKEAVGSNPSVLVSDNPKSLKQLLQALRHYEALQLAHLEATRESDYYRSETLRLQRGEASKDSQTKALLKVTTDARKQAEEIVLDWHEVFGSIDNIVKKLFRTPRNWLMNKYFAMVLIAGIGALSIGYIASQPGAVAGIGNWLSRNQATVVALAVISSIAAYFIYRKTTKEKK